MCRYLLRLDETGTPSYVVCSTGDSLSRPSTLSRESIGVGTSISSILNSYVPRNQVAQVVVVLIKRQFTIT